jgi:hypothetical protein
MKRKQTKKISPSNPRKVKNCPVCMKANDARNDVCKFCGEILKGKKLRIFETGELEF